MFDLSITNHLNIVNYVFLGIFTFLSLLVLHFIIVSIVGLFCNKNIQQVLKKEDTDVLFLLEMKKTQLLI